MDELIAFFSALLQTKCFYFFDKESFPGSVDKIGQTLYT